MKKHYLFIFLFGVSLSVHSQAVLTINGATTGTPTLYIKNGAFLNVSGGIMIDQAGSASSASNDYLQNNGTIRILSDSTPGQSDFTSNVKGLKTYTNGQTTGEVIFSANNETQSITGGGSVQFMKLTTNNVTSPTLDLQEDVTVNGLCTIGGAAVVINPTTLTLNGNLAATGTLTGSSSSNLIINGSGNLGSALSFSGGAQELRNFVLNRGNVSGHTILLGSNLSVTDTLALGNGILNVEGNNLILPATAALTGAPYTSGNMIQADGAGQFIRGVNSGAGSYIFPVGDGAPAYSPATINFSANAGSGTVGVNLKPVAHPQINNPSAATDFIKRYWTFSNTGITTYNYTGSFQYLNSDIVGTESAIKLNRWVNPWSGYPGSTAASNILTITSALDQSLAPLSGDFTGRNMLCSVATGIVTASHDSTCAGNQETLTTTGSNGTLQWQSSYATNNFTDINGANSSSYTTIPLTQTTYYRVNATNGACHDSSAPFTLVVKQLPSPPTPVAADSVICFSDSTQVCVPDTFTSYLWNTGETKSCIYADQAGGYWVTVTGRNGCVNTSEHTTIKGYPVPSVSILLQGDTLASFNAVAYQWYLDNNQIPNATSNIYIVREPGYYALEITDSNGCKALSNSVYVNPVGINDLKADPGIKIYPNPVSSGTLYLDVSKELVGCVSQIIDISGRVITSKVINKERSELDVSAFSAGFYLICIKQGYSFIGADRFVKE